MNIRRACEWLIFISVVAGNVASAQGWPYAAGAQAASPSVPFVPPAVENPFYTDQCPPPPDMENVYAQLLPSDRGWCYDYDSRLDLTLRQMVAGAWFRLEYLGGSVYRDNGRTLGAPLDASSPPTAAGPATDVADPSQQFTVLYADGVTTGLAQVPTTKNIKWNSAQGIRGSFGFPITDRIGVESRWWYLGNAADSINVGSFPPDGSITTSVRIPVPGSTQQVWVNPALIGPNGATLNSFLATSLTTNGVPGNQLIIYDTAFHSLYTSNLWTGDADVVYNVKIPDQGWRVQTIMGYRHENYGEMLDFGGTFSNQQLGRIPPLNTSTVPSATGYTGTTVLTNPVSNDFYSKVDNSRNQGQFGLRLEWAYKGVTLGAQEKVALGMNSVDQYLAVQNVRDPGNSSLGVINDPAFTATRAKAQVFAPTSDLELYCKLRMTDWCNFRIGWQCVWMGKVAVADQGIKFNQTDVGGVSTADVVAQIGYKDRVFSLLTLGGEILLP